MKHHWTMMIGCVAAIAGVGLLVALGGPNWLLYAAVLACPLMMIFMMRGMGKEDEHDPHHADRGDRT
jgi:hypothetical protein